MDGSLWFAGFPNKFEIGQITEGGVARSYNLSKLLPGRLPLVQSVAFGQDGNLYVLDNHLDNTATVYRLSPSALPALREVSRPQSRR